MGNWKDIPSRRNSWLKGMGSRKDVRARVCVSGPGQSVGSAEVGLGCGLAGAQGGELGLPC